MGPVLCFQEFADASGRAALITPHLIEAETAVLGACLLERSAIEVLGASLTPDDFFRGAHRTIYSAMLRLRERNQPIDTLLLMVELGPLQLQTVGGPAYIAHLLDGVPRSTNLLHYAGVVRRLADLRRLTAFADKLNSATKSEGANAVQLMAWSQEQLREIGASLACDRVAISLPDLAARLAGQPARQTALGMFLGLGEITMLHGQPRDGKTWVALDCAIAVALGDTALGLEDLRADTRRSVLIAGNEDGEEAVLARMRMLLAGRGVTSMPENIHLIVRQGCDLDDSIWQQRLIFEIRRTGAGLVILDPIRSLTGCVDQGPRDLQPLAAYLRELLKITGAALLIVHHDSKPLAFGRDNRRPAQRASGGGIFSIADAPIHVDGLEPSLSRLTPDGWKFSNDPSPLKVERQVVGPGAVRLVGIRDDVDEPGRLQDVIVAHLQQHPSQSQRAIAEAVGADRHKVGEALRSLKMVGRVSYVQGPRRAIQWKVQP